MGFIGLFRPLGVCFKPWGLVPSLQLFHRLEFLFFKFISALDVKAALTKQLIIGFKMQKHHLVFEMCCAAAGGEQE